MIIYKNSGHRSMLTKIRYLNENNTATSLFDGDGFYKSGDIAHRVGEYYIFDGRASIDCMSHSDLHYSQALNFNIISVIKTGSRATAGTCISCNSLY